jgi:putative transposase
MKAVCKMLGVSLSNIAAQMRQGQQRRGRPAAPVLHLLDDIRDILETCPTYGYRRVHAVLRRRYQARGVTDLPNHKRVYRVMKAHGLLLQQRRSVTGAERRHDGRIAVDRSDLRWCSDAFEIACRNGEKVRVAFALDCCDREVLTWIATTGGIRSGHIQDLQVEALEHRFGAVERLPSAIEWLSDNGSPYIASDTRRFARELGFLVRTTPVRSPQSNGMAESFVKTFKRDYVDVHLVPDAETVLRQLPEWFEHYNEQHPHKALRMRSPREYRRALLAQAA